MCEARRRVRRLEQENEVLRRVTAHLSQANLPGRALPARRRPRGERCACRCLFGSARTPTLAVLPLAQDPITYSENTEAYLADALSTPIVTTPSSATDSSSTRSATLATRWVSARCGGSARTTAGGACPGRRSAARRLSSGAPARRPRASGLHRRRASQLWLTDLTEHRTLEGKLYLCRPQRWSADAPRREAISSPCRGALLTARPVGLCRADQHFSHFGRTPAKNDL